MAERYNPVEIEPKWQCAWEGAGLYKRVEDPNKPKHYALTMLPYPSGDLHIGHWYAMTPSDARARFMRMQGYNVFFPMGFDAFGLPAENAAIRDGIHPMVRTAANIERMRQQLRSMGAMFDWEHEAVSSDPGYYKWTEWFFLQFYKMGLAYRTNAPVDWCPSCQTTLAREQVWGEDRHCERCGTPVIKKDLDQWLFRITNYAEELLQGLEKINWPERVKVMQRNWIGRSEGAEVTFHIAGPNGPEKPFVIFTTRPDTLWGATFMVLAPEHPLVDEITTDAQREAVNAYKLQAARQSEIERTAADKEKTGVWTGAYALNLVNDERIPVWIADYVLMTYGTGAIMAVPAHDQRDFEFARKYHLPIRVVIQPEGEVRDEQTMMEAYDHDGIVVNSGPITGLPASVAVKKVIAWLEETRKGHGQVNYRLHDWLISRQRYWGAPIPIIYCPTCGEVPVPEADLPVLLPENVNFMPTGVSPLKLSEEFRYVKCPKCGGEEAERETDTMDTFMCSSWYQYAYISPYYKGNVPFDPNIGKYWLPVDQYTGGIEHATMHLLYTRFFTKAMRDMSLVDFDEPMLSLFNQGMILGEDNEKMSKSRGNVVNPDELVTRYGADAVRAYLMFIGPWELGGPWNPQGIEGIVRFLNRVWAVVSEASSAKPAAQADEKDVRALRRKVHQTLIKVTDDYRSFHFNTLIAALMELTNTLTKARDTAVYGTETWNEAIRLLLLMIAPAMPHISEELWQRSGNAFSIHTQSWPVADLEAAKEDVMNLVVQINGKVRERLELPAGSDEAAVRAAALASERVKSFINGQTVRKVIYAPGKLVNIVVG